jgi:hypothetical protein
VEAICVSVKGTQRLQLSRQLTAMALNCCISDFQSDCQGDSSLSDLFNSCNEECANPTDVANITDCIKRIDCFNNGGVILEDGDLFCQTGTCEPIMDGIVAQIDGGIPCNEKTSCGEGFECVPLPGNCHDRDLCPDATDDGEINGSALCFDPPGPAGSSNACNNAVGNSCRVIGPGEANCSTDSCP